MSDSLIDLRSDTVTRPTPEMLEAMMNAKVGDDVFEEDPTVIELEELAAQMFGKEAGIFCPSGTMTNQIAIKVHTEPMSEVILEENSPPYLYEGGGIAFNSSASVRLLKGDRGRIKAAQVRSAVNPDNVHFPVSRMVSIENTANRGGGACYDINDVKEIRDVCAELNLKLHLDGARIFNALVASGYSAIDFGQFFDTISVCLSKGLGAPVGSLLLGSKEDIKQARRVRKVLGGGMRQAGFLAAAGIYALQNHVQRLAEDHKMAATIGEFVREQPYVADLLPVETNIVVFELVADRTPADFLSFLESHNVKAVPFGGQWVRFVSHLDLNDPHIERLKHIMEQY